MLENNALHWPHLVAMWGVIAMRRLGTIMALGALLDIFAGVVAAFPAFALGGQVVQFQPITLTG
jgi:hypothetical protein